MFFNKIKRREQVQGRRRSRKARQVKRVIIILVILLAIGIGLGMAWQTSSFTFQEPFYQDQAGQKDTPVVR